MASYSDLIGVLSITSCLIMQPNPLWLSTTTNSTFKVISFENVHFKFVTPQTLIFPLTANISRFDLSTNWWLCLILSNCALLIIEMSATVSHKNSMIDPFTLIFPVMLLEFVTV